LVEAVMPFLDEWQVLLKDIRQLTPERVNGMLERAERLRHQADLAGQGGVVHHVEVCIQCLQAPALDRRGFQEALRNLSEVTWQLKQEAGAPARRAGGPVAAGPVAGGPAAGGPQSMARPPLLSDAGAPTGPASPGARGMQPPPPISLPGAVLPGAVLPGGASPGGGFDAPPRLDRSLVAGMARPPVVEPARGGFEASPQREAPPRADVSRDLGGPRQPSVAPPPGASSHHPVIAAQGARQRPDPARPEPAPSPPPRPFEPAGPSIIPRAGAAPSPAPPASPPILGGRAPLGQPKAKDKPNLLVATMFGLRAFGRGKGAPPASPLPSPLQHGQPAPAPGQHGVLGLGKRASSREQNEPRWVGPREGGLPELATRGPEPAAPAADGVARDIDDRLRKLRSGSGSGSQPRELRSESRERRSSRPTSGADRARSDRASARPDDDDESSGRRRPREGSFPVPWWIGGVAVALVGLVVVALLVFGRSRPSATGPTTTPAVAGGADTELPTSRLLDDKERMKALLNLVHDYGGGESPELADLVNEEAALVYEVMEQSCQQPGDKCERPAPMIAGTVRTASTPQHEIRHLFEERKLEAHTPRSGQVPKWLAGLSTPAIGTEDDANVRRWVEYYTQNHVGREEFQNMLFRCGAYQDLIEKTLVQNGMPRALLALVMTESGCVPHAESPVGARGLWQFMPATARAYHLHVKDGVIDERISPPKSTEAAVKFLADLYRKMGSWEFALASYNMGPFGLAARIKRAGGDVTFWDLAAAGFLPEETAKYVPRIQAYALILENLARFSFSTAQMRATEVTAELEAPPGTRLGIVARAASTSLDHLKLLNPDIVGTVVPDLPGSRFMVQVPKEDVFRARSVLEQLLADGDQSDRCVSSAFDWGSERFTEKMCGGGDTGGGKKKKKRQKEL
jgi:hypothetical protein